MKEKTLNFTKCNILRSIMAITRGQIPAQIDGKLRGARDEKEKKKRVKLAIKRKKNPLAKTFTV